MIQTPSNLELLLHTYCSAEPHPRLSAPAIQDGIRYLKENDMIAVGDEGELVVTARGGAYIKHILAVPFPVAVWTVPKEPSP